MNKREAADLLRPAVAGRSGAWADWGAGSGTFTRALVELLEPGSSVYAIDRNAPALAGQKKTPRIHVVVADFTEPVALDEARPRSLDGMLFANALHFVEDAAAVLTRLCAAWLGPAGRVVLVEYDGRGPNRWVPYPIPAVLWPEMAEAAGLSDATIRARRRSAFGGDLYVATADRN